MLEYGYEPQFELVRQQEREWGLEQELEWVLEYGFPLERNAKEQGEFEWK